MKTKVCVKLDKLNCVDTMAHSAMPMLTEMRIHNTVRERVTVHMLRLGTGNVIQFEILNKRQLAL